MSAETLERSVLEGKDREQLIAIADRLGAQGPLPGQEGRDHRSDPRADRGRAGRRDARLVERQRQRRRQRRRPRGGRPAGSRGRRLPERLPTGPSTRSRPRSTTSRRPTGSVAIGDDDGTALTTRQRRLHAPTAGGRRPSASPSSPSAAAEGDPAARHEGLRAVHRPPRRPQRGRVRTDRRRQADGADGQGGNRRRRRRRRKGGAVEDGPQGATARTTGTARPGSGARPAIARPASQEQGGPASPSRCPATSTSGTRATASSA